MLVVKTGLRFSKQSYNRSQKLFSPRKRETQHVHKSFAVPHQSSANNSSKSTYSNVDKLVENAKFTEDIVKRWNWEAFAIFGVAGFLYSLYTSHFQTKIPDKVIVNTEEKSISYVYKPYPLYSIALSSALLSGLAAKLISKSYIEDGKFFSIQSIPKKILTSVTFGTLTAIAICITYNSVNIYILDGCTSAVSGATELFLFKMPTEETNETNEKEKINTAFMKQIVSMIQCIFLVYFCK